VTQSCDRADIRVFPYCSCGHPISIASHRAPHRTPQGRKCIRLQRIPRQTLQVPVLTVGLCCCGRWSMPVHGAGSERVASRLTIRLLGPLDMWVGERPLAPLHSRKESWALALLILRHPRPVERDWLAGTLWPDAFRRRFLPSVRATRTICRML